MKPASLRCYCGHNDYDHTPDLKRHCVHVDCPCREFSPSAGQRGLTHWADLLGPFAPTYTLCYKIAPLKFITQDPQDVNCPDCLLELKHREYLRQLGQLAARASSRRHLEPRYKKRGVRPLDLLTKEQLRIFETLMNDHERRHERNYCWQCDYWGCDVVGRHMGPLIISFTALDSIRKEIKMLLAIRGLLSQRRRQTDAFLRRRKLALAGRQF